jgi:cytochrome oxidase assembly protein ShyY1
VPYNAYRGGVRRFAFLLRPGWLALVAGVLVFAAACFWVLSPWQFGRNTERSTQNSEITNALNTPPVAIRQLLPADTTPGPKLQWRAVTLTGHYLPNDETVARLRQVYDEPAYEVLTPFRLDDGSTVLVDRGYVGLDNGGVAAFAPAPAGPRTLTARLHQQESDAHRPPLTEHGRREIYSINPATITALTGQPLDPAYVALVYNQPGGLGVLPVPQIDEGPFLSYALQWIAFGVMALLGFGYFTWREIQPGGALTAEARARRKAEKQVRGRRAVAAMIAEDEARERATSGDGRR